MEEERKVKQVIVIRTKYPDGKGGYKGLRLGKYCSQAAHASLKAILDLGPSITFVNTCYRTKTILYKEDSPLAKWLDGIFTKICVSVDSEEELLKVYNEAKEKGIICALITDAGATEFNGVPTNTCCAIGPGYSDIIDQITGGLKLL